MFSDRRDAGKKLATALEKYRGKDIVIVGIPRGGVLVAWEVAKHLNAPLEIVVVKKLGYPGNHELALGAVSPDHHYLNPELARTVPRDYIDVELKTKQREARMRVEMLKGRRKPIEFAGKTVIVIDDGVATGASMKIALRVIKEMKPNSIVVAVPVAPPDSVQQLKHHADEVIAVLQPASFYAIGQFYSDFTQVEDEEVQNLLRDDEV